MLYDFLELVHTLGTEKTGVVSSKYLFFVVKFLMLRFQRCSTYITR